MIGEILIRNWEANESGILEFRQISALTLSSNIKETIYKMNELCHIKNNTCSKESFLQVDFTNLDYLISLKYDRKSC